MTTENLYNNLHQSSSGWDEDFLTEALVHLIKYLQEHESNAAYAVVNCLTANLPQSVSAHMSEITISTQFATNSGYPDICIRHPAFLVFIEVKVDADFHYGQLEGYRKVLSESSLPNVRLITLTRYGQAGERSEVDLAIRWNQVADWLTGLALTREVSRYLRAEFVGFLHVRGVAMDRVEWDLVPGIKSMLSLLNMLVEAMASAQIKYDTATAGKSWQGYLKKYDGKKRLFIGIYLDRPSEVCVQTENCTFAADLELSRGQIVNGKWTETLDLSSEEVHFFARTKQSQLACLESFLSDAVRYADKLVQDGS